ncbi:MAG TPA: sugar transferase [Thermoanaerobaculia bacterium]|nr:sugar transferase [Thermoanaerobaculia bacterium]
MIRPGSKERALRTGILVAGDALIGGGALAAVVELRRHVDLRFTELLPHANFPLTAANVALFVVPLLAALALSGFYTFRVTPHTRPSIVTALVIRTALTAIGGALLVQPLPRTVLFAVPLLELAALPLWRRLLRAIAPVRPRETILVGEPHDVAEAIAGLHLAGDQRIRVDEEACIPVRRLAHRPTRAMLHEAEEVILVSPDADALVRLELLRIRGPRGFLMLASHVDALLASSFPGWIGDQPLVEVAVSCGYGVRAIVKRAIDFAVSAVLILLSAPLWIATSLAILLDDGGPVLIRQSRVGRGGRTFGMWKFRSMHGDPDDTTAPKHLTRIGALLRRYHLDELPQLLNVLIGDMSLVGPRPERPELAEAILREVPDFDLRALVRPGIAGLAQVSAEYDTRPEVKLRYDLMYMCDWSVWLDVRLMLRAVTSSLAGTGR